MSLFIIFGFPGAGKTFVGNVLREHYNIHVHDGDDELPDRMNKAIQKSRLVTDDMRDEFFENIIRKLKHLTSTYPAVALTQTCIKERYRKHVLKEFPYAVFLLVQTDTDTREKRLSKRTTYPLNIEYARRMVANFGTGLNNNVIGFLLDSFPVNGFSTEKSDMAAQWNMLFHETI